MTARLPPNESQMLGASIPSPDLEKQGGGRDEGLGRRADLDQQARDVQPKGCKLCARREAVDAHEHLMICGR